MSSPKSKHRARSASGGAKEKRVAARHPSEGAVKRERPSRPSGLKRTAAKQSSTKSASSIKPSVKTMFTVKTQKSREKKIQAALPWVRLERLDITTINSLLGLTGSSNSALEVGMSESEGKYGDLKPMSVSVTEHESALLEQQNGIKYAHNGSAAVIMPVHLKAVREKKMLVGSKGDVENSELVSSISVEDERIFTKPKTSIHRARNRSTAASATRSKVSTKAVRKRKMSVESKSDFKNLELTSSVSIKEDETILAKPKTDIHHARNKNTATTVASSKVSTKAVKKRKMLIGFKGDAENSESFASIRKNKVMSKTDIHRIRNGSTANKVSSSKVSTKAVRKRPFGSKSGVENSRPVSYVSVKEQKRALTKPKTSIQYVHNKKDVACTEPNLLTSEPDFISQDSGLGSLLRGFEEDDKNSLKSLLNDLNEVAGSKASNNTHFVSSILKMKPVIKNLKHAFGDNSHVSVIMDAAMVSDAFEFFNYQKSVTDILYNELNIVDDPWKNSYAVIKKVDFTSTSNSNSDLGETLQNEGSNSHLQCLNNEMLTTHNKKSLSCVSMQTISEEMQIESNEKLITSELDLGAIAECATCELGSKNLHRNTNCVEGTALNNINQIVKPSKNVKRKDTKLSSTMRKRCKTGTSPMDGEDHLIQNDELSIIQNNNAHELKILDVHGNCSEEVLDILLREAGVSSSPPVTKPFSGEICKMDLVSNKQYSEERLDSQNAIAANLNIVMEEQNFSKTAEPSDNPLVIEQDRNNAEGVANFVQNYNMSGSKLSVTDPTNLGDNCESFNISTTDIQFSGSISPAKRNLLADNQSQHSEDINPSEGDETVSELKLHKDVDGTPLSNRTSFDTSLKQNTICKRPYKSDNFGDEDLDFEPYESEPESCNDDDLQSETAASPNSQAFVHEEQEDDAGSTDKEQSKCYTDKLSMELPCKSPNKFSSFDLVNSGSELSGEHVNKNLENLSLQHDAIDSGHRVRENQKQVSRILNRNPGNGTTISCDLLSKIFTSEQHTLKESKGNCFKDQLLPQNDSNYAKPTDGSPVYERDEDYFNYGEIPDMFSFPQNLNEMNSGENYGNFLVNGSAGTEPSSVLNEKPRKFDYDSSRQGQVRISQDRQLNFKEHPESSSVQSFNRQTSNNVQENGCLPEDQARISEKFYNPTEMRFDEVLCDIQEQCELGNLRKSLNIAKVYIPVSEPLVQKDIFRQLFEGVMCYIKDRDCFINKDLCSETIKSLTEIFYKFNLYDSELCSLLVSEYFSCKFTISNGHDVLAFCQDRKIPVDCEAISSYMTVVKPPEIPFDVVISFLEYVKNVCNVRSPKLLLHDAVNRFLKHEESSLHLNFYKFCKFLCYINSQEIDRTHLQPFVEFCLENECWKQVADFFCHWINNNCLLGWLHQALACKLEDAGLFYEKLAQEIQESENVMPAQLVNIFGQVGVALMLEAFSFQHSRSAFEILWTLHKYSVPYLQLQEALYTSETHLKAFDDPTKVFVFPFTVAFTALDICFQLERPKDAYRVIQSFVVYTPENVNKALEIKRRHFQYLFKLACQLHPLDPLGIGIQAFQYLLSVLEEDFSKEEFKENVKEIQPIFNKYLISLLNGQENQLLMEVYSRTLNGPRKDSFILQSNVLRGMMIHFIQNGLMEEANILFTLGYSQNVYDIVKPSLGCYPWHIKVKSIWTCEEIRYIILKFLEILDSELALKSTKMEFMKWFAVKIYIKKCQPLRSQLASLKVVADIDSAKQRTCNVLKDMDPDIAWVEQERYLQLEAEPFYYFWASKFPCSPSKINVKSSSIGSKPVSFGCKDSESLLESSEAKFTAQCYDAPESKLCTSEKPSESSLLTKENDISRISNCLNQQELVSDSVIQSVSQRILSEGSIQVTCMGTDRGIAERVVYKSSNQIHQVTAPPTTSENLNPVTSPQNISSISLSASPQTTSKRTNQLTPTKKVSNTKQLTPPQTISKSTNQVTSPQKVSKSINQLTAPNVSKSTHQVISLQTISKNINHLTSPVSISKNTLQETSPGTILKQSPPKRLSSGNTLQETSPGSVLKQSPPKRLSSGNTLQETSPGSILKQSPPKRLSSGNTCQSFLQHASSMNRTNAVDPKSIQITIKTTPTLDEGPRKVSPLTKVVLEPQNQPVIKPSFQPNVCEEVFLKITNFLKSKVIIRRKDLSTLQQQQRAVDLAQNFIRKNTVTVLDKKMMKLLNDYSDKCIY